MKTYKYVGPHDLLELTKTASKGEKIVSPMAVLAWVHDTGQEVDYEHQVIATFIIDLDTNLLIADRHSEHVVCAGGENVLSAGEMTFCIEGTTVKVSDVTNQSTGYCPEPESWPSVNEALVKAGLEGPESFSREFIFRRCATCGLLNIVKEEWFVCAECDENLSKTWNIR